MKDTSLSKERCRSVNACSALATAPVNKTREEEEYYQRH